MGPSRAGLSSSRWIRFGIRFGVCGGRSWLSPATPTESSDLHDQVFPVATHLPIFLDKSTLSPVLLVTASHGRSRRAVSGFISHPLGFFRRLRGGMQEYAAGFCPLRALEYPHIPISECLNPVEVIYQTALATIRPATCSHASEMPYTSDSRKRARLKQIRGKAWIFHGIITTDADRLHPAWSSGVDTAYLSQYFDSLFSYSLLGCLEMLSSGHSIFHCSS